MTYGPRLWGLLRERHGAVAWTLSLFVLGCLCSAPTARAAPSGRTIVERMKVALEPDRPSLRTIIMVMRSPGGDNVRWTGRQARKKLPDGKRILTVLLAPADVKGTALLIKERKNRGDEQWIYLPALRRIRRLAPVSGFESFMGTDFTFADLGLVKLHERSFTLLGQKTLDGRPAYKVDEVPANRSYYSRIVTWIARDSMLPLRRDFYDVTKHLWKTELIKDTTVIDGVPTPLDIVMEDKQEGTSTELRISEVQYDAKIPDELFDPDRLPQVVNDPVWAPPNAPAK
jgi:Outer membrane lipoprotein-sorting protein